MRIICLFIVCLCTFSAWSYYPPSISIQYTMALQNFFQKDKTSTKNIHKITLLNIKDNGNQLVQKIYLKNEQINKIYKHIAKRIGIKVNSPIIQQIKKYAESELNKKQTHKKYCVEEVSTSELKLMNIKSYFDVFKPADLLQTVAKNCVSTLIPFAEAATKKQITTSKQIYYNKLSRSIKHKGRNKTQLIKKDVFKDQCNGIWVYSTIIFKVVCWDDYLQDIFYTACEQEALTALKPVVAYKSLCNYLALRATTKTYSKKPTTRYLYKLVYNQAITKTYSKKQTPRDSYKQTTTSHCNTWKKWEQCIGNEDFISNFLSFDSDNNNVKKLDLVKLCNNDSPCIQIPNTDKNPDEGINKDQCVTLLEQIPIYLNEIKEMKQQLKQYIREFNRRAFGLDSEIATLENYKP